MLIEPYLLDFARSWEDLLPNYFGRATQLFSATESIVSEFYMKKKLLSAPQLYSSYRIYNTLVHGARISSDILSFVEHSFAGHLEHLRLVSRPFAERQV
jgi:hypothetical protein